MYFRKVLINQPVTVAGKIVPFEHIGGVTGVLALDPEADKVLVEGLSDFAQKRKGGVTKINLLQYETLKKKFRLLKSGRRTEPEKLRVLPTMPSPFNQPRRQDPPGVVGPAVEAPSPSASSAKSESKQQPAATADPATPKKRFTPQTRSMSLKAAMDSAQSPSPAPSATPPPATPSQ